MHGTFALVHDDFAASPWAGCDTCLRWTSNWKLAAACALHLK